MINLQNVRDLYTNLDFKKKGRVRLNPNRNIKPREKSLNTTLILISKNPKITRQRLLDCSGFSVNCLDRCLKHLIENKKIIRVFFRNAGPSKSYTYEIKD